MDNLDMEYSPDILTLLDEDGVEHQFEVADSMELDGERYMALVPIFDEAEELLEDSGELVVLQVATHDGEDFLEPIEDEGLFHKVADLFMERLEEEYDFVEEE